MDSFVAIFSYERDDPDSIEVLGYTQDKGAMIAVAQAVLRKQRKISNSANPTEPGHKSECANID